MAEYIYIYIYVKSYKKGKKQRKMKFGSNYELFLG